MTTWNGQILCVFILFIAEAHYPWVMADCNTTEINDLISSIPGITTVSCDNTTNGNCTFQCSAGVLQGGNTLMCTETGGSDVWVGNCPSECTEFTCAPINNPEVLIVCDQTGTPDYPLNTQCNFSCNATYRIERSQHAICSFNQRTFQTEWCYNGWSEPICTETGCAHILLRHGRCNYTSTRIGAEARCSCDEGFLLEGPETVTCLGSVVLGTYWNPNLPRCVPCRKKK